MVWIRKGVNNGITFYELRHNVKIEGKVRVMSKYLGRSVPENVIEIQKRFLQEIDSNIMQRVFNPIKGTTEIATPSTGTKRGIPIKVSFGVYFTFVSQRMSGCKLTLLEASRLLEKNKTRWERSASDNMETKAHYFLYNSILTEKRSLSFEMINDWHWKLFRNTKPAIAGLLRKDIARTSFAEYDFPEANRIEEMLRNLIYWYLESNDLHPVMVAGIMHSMILMIHPFSGGNGRIARLALNYVLHRHGYPMYGFDERQVERICYYNSLIRSLERNDYREITKWFYRRYKRNYVKRKTFSS